jgi:hypothetical protein
VTSWKDAPVVAGGKIITGFMVVGDDAPRPHNVPSLSASEFSKVIGLTVLQKDWGPFVQPLVASVPFSMIWTVYAEQAERTFIFIGPADLIRRREVKMWRIYLSEPEWKKKDAPVLFVERAEPVE